LESAGELEMRNGFRKGSSQLEYGVLAVGAKALLMEAKQLATDKE